MGQLFVFALSQPIGPSAAIWWKEHKTDFVIHVPLHRMFANS